MADMDKFKRRLIQTYARLHTREKKTEDQVWEQFREETRCDCKLLWERMKALTIKKLKRLLLVEDQTHMIAPVAQMTQIDWLLFDLVLVHEDVDVLGFQCSDSSTRMKQSKVLQDLFDLIEQFDIEGARGDSLRDAWIAATLAYNVNGRYISPMLLQKRWYQMKKQTREEFYTFWYNYRGNQKLLTTCKNLIPNEQEMAIAKRYPHIITKHFMDWNTLLENKCVVLPEDFENKMNAKSKESQNNDPDIILIQPSIETIEVGDGDSDLEDSIKVPDTDTVAESPNTQPSIKEEPQDDTVSSSVNSNTSDDILENETEITESTASTIDMYVRNYNADIIEQTGVPTEVLLPNMDTSTQCIVADQSVIQCHETEVEILNEDDYVDPIVMPQIANVFGNVNEDIVMGEFDKPEIIVRSENVINNSDDIDKVSQSHENNIDNEMECDKTTTKEIPEMPEALEENISETNNIVKVTDTAAVTNVPIELEGNIEVNDKSKIQSQHLYTEIPFELLINEDDGVQIVDDGIKFVEDDENDISTPCSPNSEESILEEPCTNTTTEDKFDSKLLMKPVVLITKIQDMSIFKNVRYPAVTDNRTIDKALIESKPKSQINYLNNHTKNNKNEGNFFSERDDAVVPVSHFDHIPSPSLVDDGDEIVLTGGIVEDDMDRDEAMDDISNDSSHYIPDDMKVKLSSYMLQKPRTRNYNPIQLCKNPDFNTRLKRLTFGFLSSSRNRAFLKTLKPMTIDVSKAFEKKLIDNTIYLKTGDVDMNTGYADIKNDITKQTTTVLPSAMTVQSLIYNDFIETVPPKSAPRIIDGKNDHLSDLENIQKMNNRVMIAEIAPMSNVSFTESCKPPVQLLPFNTNNQALYIEPRVTQKVANVDSKVKEENEISNISVNTEKRNEITDTSNANKSCSNKANNKKPSKQNINRPNWVNAKINTNAPNKDDALLTVDTLIKMLILCQNKYVVDLQKKYAGICKKDYTREFLQLDKNIKKFENKVSGRCLKACIPEKQANVESIPECENDSISNEKRDSQEDNNKIKKNNEPKQKKYKTKNNNELIVEENEKILESNPSGPAPSEGAESGTFIKIKSKKNSENIFCCWASYKMYNLRAAGYLHKCIRICKCCCRNALLEYKRPKPNKKILALSESDENMDLKNVETSIEAVIQNSGQTKPLRTYIDASHLNRSNSAIQCDMEPIKKSDGFDDTRVLHDVTSNQNEHVKSSISQPQYSFIVKYKRKPTNITTANNKISDIVNDHCNRALLNELSKSNLSKKPPIYLGPAHILLTDVDASPNTVNPVNVNSTPDKGTLTSPASKQNSPTNSDILPPGVNLILLPNGKVSYTVKPEVKLDETQKVYVKSLLAEVQRNLDPAILPGLSEVESSTSSTTTSSITTSFTTTSSITTFSTTASSTKTRKEDKEDDIIDLEEADSDYLNDTNKANIDISSDKIEQIKAKPDNDDVINNMTLTPIANDEQLNVVVSSPIIDLTNEEETVPNVSELNNAKSQITLNIPEECKKLSDNEVTKDSTDKINTSSRKTLLSDLMEMSGISAEDVKQPVPDESPIVENSVTPSFNLTTADNQKLNIAAFTTIHSFDQLKEASLSKKKFYKLDLKTGTVSTVSLVIEKQSMLQRKNNLPVKQIFTVLNNKNNVQEKGTTSSHSTSPSKESDSSPTQVSTSSLKSGPFGAKPLKLFKSVNILKRKVDEDCNNLTNDAPEPDLNVDEKVYEIETEIVPGEFDHCNDLDEYVWRLNEADDMSSDDEPLAFVAKRIRLNEVTNECSSQQDNENLLDFSDSLERDEAIHEGSDDDCILGV